MKVFSANQIKEWDKFTVAEQDISSHELMERAAHACFSWLEQKYSSKNHFYIFCGNGNNGGDGLALARLLIEESYNAVAVLLNPEKVFSDDAQINLDLLKRYAPQNIIAWDNNFSPDDILSHGIIIDAVFGTGLNRILDGDVAAKIQLLNGLSNIKISIDIPSGIFADTLVNTYDICFSADYTLSFQGYKRSFLHPESAGFAGQIVLLDIGLSSLFESEKETDFYITDEKDILTKYKKRNPFSHKGTFGTAILVGGSYGKIGAIALSAKAALRSGVGKVFVQAPECGYDILQSFVPEAMFKNGGENYIDKIDPDQNAVIGLGPGLGTIGISATAIGTFLNNYKDPLVIDADALNIIAENKEKLLPLIPEKTIITPHPKEFERLFGKTNSSFEQTDLAINKAKEYNIVIVLKGHRTAVCTPDGNCFYNLTGNAGMATAGSGDVLTGIITGLLGQGYISEDTAKIGVYLHGLSGDIAAKEISQEALIARDLIEHIGKAFLHLQHPTV